MCKLLAVSLSSSSPLKMPGVAADPAEIMRAVMPCHSCSWSALISCMVNSDAELFSSAYACEASLSEASSSSGSGCCWGSSFNSVAVQTQRDVSTCGSCNKSICASVPAADL